MKKVLVIGRGFLGDYIYNELKNCHFEVFYSYFTNKVDGGVKLDITNNNLVERVFDKILPDLVINCAANTNVDYLESHPIEAHQINSEGAKNVATASKNHNIRLIHISTDGVFDGKNGKYKEEDIPNPVNVYGESKLEGEKFVEKTSADYLIVRTNFFGYDPNGLFLFNWILNSLKKNKKIVGFKDVIFSPLEISNLAKMIVELGLKDFKGVIHLSSDETITKYQFIKNVAKEFDLDTNLIRKGSIQEAELKAERPRNTSLDNTRSKNFLITKPLCIERALKIIRKNYYKGIFTE